MPKPYVRYSQKLADKICELLELDNSMRAICEMEGMPDRTSVLNWMKKYPEFSAKCARARLQQADTAVDDMKDIESGVLKGKIDATAARVVLSSMQWRAMKMAPKKYAATQVEKELDDREHTVTGGLPEDVTEPYEPPAETD